VFYHFAECSGDLRVCLSGEYPRDTILLRLYGPGEANSTALRQAKLLCLLSLLPRTFNSLKSAGEQSTEYNSLRLIYVVRFILFAYPFFPAATRGALQARSATSRREIAPERDLLRAFKRRPFESSNGFPSLPSSLDAYIYIYILILQITRAYASAVPSECLEETRSISAYKAFYAGCTLSDQIQYITGTKKTQVHVRVRVYS